MEFENFKRIVCKIANVSQREIKLSVACFLLALIVIVGCRKDNELPSSSVSVINAVVSNGNNYNEKIAVVKLLVDTESIYDPDRQVMIWQGVEVAKGDYRNGGFVINLPDDIDNIKPFDLELPTEAKISNMNVKYANSRFIAFNKDDEQLGYFYCFYLYMGEETLTMNEGGVLYFDRDFTITGSGTDDGERWSITCNFKKGWNFLYIIRGGTSDGILPVRMTTSKPDITMFWSFRANDDNRY